MAKFEKIIYEKEGPLAFITINRPDRMNAIDPQTSKELHEAWSDYRDDDKLRAAILTGAGERAFSAGMDLVAAAEAQAGEGIRFTAPFGGNTRSIEIWKPMIAAINGYCLAGGLEMALACDIRIAAEHAQFGLTEVTRAIIPGAGGTQRLPRMVPLAFAMEIILTGGRFDAQAAYRWGLVTHVVPLPDLMPKAVEIASAICDCGPLAVKAAKQVVLRGLTMTLQEGLDLETNFARDIFQTEDAREGPLAFAQKRKPEYKGR